MFESLETSWQKREDCVKQEAVGGWNDETLRSARRVVRGRQRSRTTTTTTRRSCEMVEVQELRKTVCRARKIARVRAEHGKGIGGSFKARPRA
ncbi:hypothetical protein KPH14_003878 [Odynerus spinipes]|uniref:Uncharacterized protein n=1 Tax=Odynerus spinipes TaxID=1348599 RepID=A0AAD9RXH5_9HYME|nr:hypothetical protein KPH14_003878 [Odynerus spinipes]